MNPKQANLEQRAARAVALVLLAAMAGSGNAQQAPMLSSHAAKVKKTVDVLAPNAPISVVKEHGEKEYGKFQARDDAGFTFYDVDLKQNMTLRYEEVRKIRNGYGGENSLHHRHTDHTKGLIIAVVVLAALGGVIAAAASASN